MAARAQGVQSVVHGIAVETNQTTWFLTGSPVLPKANLRHQRSDNSNNFQWKISRIDDDFWSLLVGFKFLSWTCTVWTCTWVETQTCCFTSVSVTFTVVTAAVWWGIQLSEEIISHGSLSLGFMNKRCIYPRRHLHQSGSVLFQTFRSHLNGFQKLRARRFDSKKAEQRFEGSAPSIRKKETISKISWCLFPPNCSVCSINESKAAAATTKAEEGTDLSAEVKDPLSAAKLGGNLDFMAEDEPFEPC